MFKEFIMGPIATYTYGFILFSQKCLKYNILNISKLHLNVSNDIILFPFSGNTTIWSDVVLMLGLCRRR